MAAETRSSLTEDQTKQRPIFTLAADDFGFPVYVFDNFIDAVHPNHACLLVLEETEAVFQPIAVVGLDNTTRHRLRIPQLIIEQHGALSAGHSVVLEGEERLFLEPFLSVREFGSYSRITLSPVRHADRILALMMIAYNEKDPIVPPDTLNFPAETGERLSNSYSERLRPLPALPSNEGDESSKARIEALLRQLEQTERSLLICVVSLDVIQRAVLPYSNTVDPMKFELDLLRVFHSLTSASGYCHRNGRREITLAFPTHSADNREFLERHLLLSLSDFFPRSALTRSIFVSSTFLDGKDITLDSLTANL